MPKRGRFSRERISNELQDEFEKRVTDLATQFDTKGFRTRTFHRRFKREFQKHTIEEAMLGAGRSLTPGELAQLEKRMRERLERMQKFMDKVSANRIKRTPLSSKSIANQARLYSEQGRAEFFRFAGVADASSNTVEKWLSKGDVSTCPKCSPLNGKYFLPGKGPMPAEVCKGKGRCRCRRVQEENARIANQLRG